MVLSYEMLAFMTFGLVIFTGFYLRDRKKPKKINDLDKVINSAKYEELYNTNASGNKKLYMKYMQQQLTEERQKKLIPILGLNPEQLEIDLELTGQKEKTSVSQIILSSIIGFICLVAIGGFGIVMFLSGQSNTGMIFMVVGGLIFYLLKVMPTANIQKMIVSRREEIEREMPNFLELLASVTSSGLPISEALNKVCLNSAGVIEQEFAKVLLEAKLNGGNWRKAMEDMAFRNEVEILSDVVSDILVSYEKGTPISEVLKGTAELARKLKINKLLEKAKKLSVKIIIPMAIFNFLPIMALFMLPLLWEFTKVMGS